MINHKLCSLVIEQKPSLIYTFLLSGIDRVLPHRLYMSFKVWHQNFNPKRLCFARKGWISSKRRSFSVVMYIGLFLKLTLPTLPLKREKRNRRNRAKKLDKIDSYMPNISNIYIYVNITQNIFIIFYWLIFQDQTKNYLMK